MIEEELRASFARHEVLVPDAQPLAPAIDAGARRLRRRQRISTSIVAALALAAAVTVPMMVPNLIAKRDHLAGPGPADPVRSTVTGPLNFLVMGIDRRPTQAPTEPARTDTLMIIHVPEALDHGYMFSVPRDMMADIPGHGRDKINAAYAYGGRQLTTKAVESMTGLTFDGTAELRFEGLSRLTDALGGVPMCLDHKIMSIHTKRVFPAGCQRLDGEASLDLLRQRYPLPGGALDRDANARQFVTSLLDEAGQGDLLSNPIKLRKVIAAAGDAMTLDLPDIGIFDLAWQLRALRGGNLTGAEVPTTPGQIGALEPDPAAEDLYAALRNDNVGAWLTKR